MSTHSAVSLYSSSYLLPNDGDKIKAESVNVPLVSLADSAEYLKQRIFKYSYTGSLAETVSELGSVTSTSYSDFVLLATVSNVAVNDVFRLYYSFHYTCSGVSTIKLAIGPSRLLAFGAFGVTRLATDKESMTLIGFGDVTAPMLSGSDLQIWVQGKTYAGGNVTIWSPHSLVAEVGKP